MNWFKMFVVIMFTSVISLYSMQNFGDRVPEKAGNICPIKIGEKIPSVKLRDVNGNVTQLEKLVEGNKTIIIFYRGGWCPYCNLHLSELQNIEDDLIKLGYKLIAISIDKPEKLKESISEHQLNYDLYSDSRAEASRAFGIAFRVDDEYIQKLKSHDMDLEESSGERHHILPVPSVFIVDEERTIQFQYVNVDYRIRISPNLMLEVAKSIK